MILADKRDYRQGYKKHYSAYYKLMETNASINSKRLLLSYCVECGLKYLQSHNLEKILKELGQLGTFKFPQLITAHQDSITSENYHQLCRYCIRVKDKDRVKEDKYEIELKKIADWIEEGM